MKEAISKIGSEWMDETVENPIRLRKRNLDGKPRFVKVKVRNNEVRDEILCNAYKSSKGVQDIHKRVFLNQDRTPKESDAFIALRAERLKRENNGEKDLEIRNGKIVENHKWTTLGEDPPTRPGAGGKV